MELVIVNREGAVAQYQGQLLRFSPDERERAEMILWLLQRQAVGGAAFRLEERPS